MENRLQAYRQSREDLLARIVAELSSDERFLAAWLTGSYARNDADEMSDLDLNIVVAEPFSDLLCTRLEQVSHQTTQERLSIFRKFGEPALIHENNNNAPHNGTFTFVLYSDSALMVDWTLVPQGNAIRPFRSLLLFDKANIPVALPPAPEDLEQSQKAVAEQWAFFWMMTAITIKYIVREDGVFVTHWLEELHRILQEVERRINREPWQYLHGSLTQSHTNRHMQIESIRQICKRMQALKPRLIEFTGVELSLPSAEIETLLSLAQEPNARH